MYDYPNASYEGALGAVQYVNDQSSGILFPAFLGVIWVVILVSQLENAFARAFLTASIVITVIAIPATILSMLAPMYMYMAILMTALGVVFMKLSP